MTDRWAHSPLCSGNGIAPNPGCSCGLVEWLYREDERAVGAGDPPEELNEAALDAAERAYWADDGVSRHNMAAAIRAYLAVSGA